MSNERQILTYLWAYTSSPSVREVVLIRKVAIGAEALRRQVDGGWPANAEVLAGGDRRSWRCAERPGSG